MNPPLHQERGGAGASTTPEALYSEGSNNKLRPTNEEEDDDQFIIPEQLETADGSKYFGDYQGNLK